jgi:hypothetical protein
MDAQPLFDPKYLPVVLVTLIGFGALAALLLVPIYRFLEREEEVAQDWTPEELAKRMQDHTASANGDSTDEGRSPSESAPTDDPTGEPDGDDSRIRNDRSLEE